MEEKKSGIKKFFEEFKAFAMRGNVLDMAVGVVIGGAFTAMSQEQGTKLEGLFTSLQDHAGGMHRLLEELTKGRSADHDIFLQIAENTAYCKILEDIFDLLASKDRDGWKTI